ncbi:MAG TPA: DUF932 domain-containing protein [Polyangiaceae bacterium]|nr:DUF932 domain-containing protein [Polyangiaceae bacterium]
MNVPIRSGLLPALSVRPDMTPFWRTTAELPFDEAADLLIRDHRDDGVIEDRPLLDLRTWVVCPRGGEFAVSPLGGTGEKLPLRSTAFAGLATRLGAPAEFVRDRLPAELQLALLNYLLASQGRPLPTQLRLRGGEVTALVSDRYAALSPEQFVEGIRSALVARGVLDSVRVRGVATGTTDVLRLVLPSESREVQVGDVTAAGLDISTSCFGKSAVHVTGMLYRLVCANGLRVPERMGKLSFRHVGETARIQAALRDAIPTALFHAQGLFNLWQSAVAYQVRDLEKTIERMRLLTQAERELVTAEVKKETGKRELPESTSAYNLVNAMTAAAQQAEPARRLELESIAGEAMLRWVEA